MLETLVTFLFSSGTMSTTTTTTTTPHPTQRHHIIEHAALPLFTRAAGEAEASGEPLGPLSKAQVTDGVCIRRLTLMGGDERASERESEISPVPEHFPGTTPSTSRIQENALAY